MTKTEKEKLQKYIDDIEQAIKAKTEYLDSLMVKYASLKIGEELFDLTTGEKLGNVKRLYRFNGGLDYRYDYSCECNYEYVTKHGEIKNTSSQPRLIYGSKKEALEMVKNKLDGLL